MLIKACIDTILAQTKEITYEIIVVDNNSADDSEQQLKTHYPALHWIQMDYNAGFARANNAGIRIASGNIVLLLNPDTLVLDGALDKCVARFRTSGYVACGVQLLNPDGSPQITGNYFMQGGLNHLLPLPYWGAFLRWLGYALKTKVPNIREATGEQQVDWINGAFLMVKQTAIQQVGMLDEDFFLYAEEAEWCSRLLKAGTMAVYGDLRVVHLQGETANVTFESEDKGYYGLYNRKGLQIMLSNHVRVRKHYGVGWFLFMLLNYTFTIPIFFIFSFFHNLFLLRNPFRYWQDAAGLTKNVWQLWLLAPVIISNKPYFYKVL